MFAFALYDKNENKLILARDSAGEKPLYYGWINNIFIFASEIKALKAHPLWQTNINQLALKNFVEYNYIPTPLSIYENIYKLEANTVISVSLHNTSIELKNIIDKNLHLKNLNSKKSYEDYKKITDEKLNQVIKEQSELMSKLDVFCQVVLIHRWLHP